jgi:L-lactate dehydrogenase complex protein LldG
MSKSPIDTSASRTAILGDLTRTLSQGDDDAARRKAVKARLKGHKPNLVPERGRRDLPGRLALFREQAEAVSASVVEVAGAKDIPKAIAAWLRDQNLPSRVRHGADATLTGLPWKSAGTLEVVQGRAEPEDVVSVSRAFGAVAETGTLILASGADNPTSLNFLPENHIVVVAADTVEGAYEDIWAQLRETYGEGRMPRAVNMISGPSRTADVEQTIQLGAHGPRRLHIIVVKKL